MYGITTARILADISFSQATAAASDLDHPAEIAGHHFQDVGIIVGVDRCLLHFGDRPGLGIGRVFIGTAVWLMSRKVQADCDRRRA